MINPKHSRLALLTLFGSCFALCLYLGVWQLQRLAWKTELITRAERNSQTLLPFHHLRDWPEHAFYGLRCQGTFNHPQELYLQGRTYQGQLGVHIITPFELTDGRRIFVDRGWSPRKTIVQFSRPTGEITLTGLLYPILGCGFWTPPNTLSAKELYWIDPSLLGPKGFQSLFLVALQENGALAALSAYKSPSFRNNHFGYALTWFALALVASVFFARFAFLKSKN